MKVTHKALFFLSEDETATPQQGTVIEHEGSLWLVATWLKSNDSSALIPERILPLAKFHPAQRQDGLIVLERTIPTPLLSQNAEPELLKQFGVETLPVLAHIRPPGSIH